MGISSMTAMFKYTKNHGEGWSYKLTSDYCYRTAKCFQGFDACTSDARCDGTPFVKLVGRQLTLAEGYAWNGANWFPDVRWVMRASLVHDALLQIIDDLKGPKKHELRRCADREYYCIIAGEKGDWWAGKQYLALRGYAKGGLIRGGCSALFGSTRNIPKFDCGQEVSCSEPESASP